MTKKKLSTFEKFEKSLSKEQKKKFNEEFQELLFSELLIAVMEQDNISVRALAQAAGLSTTIIQGLKSGTRPHVSAQSIFKVIRALGFQLVAERDGTRFPLDLSHTYKN